MPLVQSVTRAATLVKLLASQDEPLGLAQIAAALGLAKGTAHGLLRTLQAEGFVQQDRATGRYDIGHDLLQLGSRRLDLNELKARALNWADDLAARTGESVRVAAFRDGGAVVVHHVFGADPGPQTLEVGSQLALHATALGKVLLAHDPGAARSLATARLEPYTFRTITDRGRLVRELADVRDQGWAVTVEEAAVGTAGLAAPVRDHGGYVVAAVGIDGAVERVCDSRSGPRRELVGEVVRVGRAVSHELGHGRPL